MPESKDSNRSRNMSPEVHRRRAVDAMADAVGELGYAGTTVSEVLERSGMSRRTFYKLFRNREECFIAAYDAALEQVMGHLALAHSGKERSPRRFEHALAALLEYLAAEPGLARLWLVEAPSLGTPGVERHERTMKQLAERLATLPGNRSNGNAPVRYEASVGAVHRVVQARLLEGRADELPELAPDLARLVSGLVGEEAAP